LLPSHRSVIAIAAYYDRKGEAMRTLTLVVALLSVTVTASQHTRREARQGTRFVSSQASSWSRGHKAALPIADEQAVLKQHGII
jgi:hypothetical protein